MINVKKSFITMKRKRNSYGAKVLKINNEISRFSNCESFIFNNKFDIGQNL